MQSTVVILEKLLQNQETQINGICLVEDFRNYTMAHVTAVGLNEYKLLIDMLQVYAGCTRLTFYTAFH